MLRHIKSPFKKRSENSDLKYLQFTRVYNYEENGHDKRDGSSSISSFSTNATMDNNPGTGRIMDKFLYQFFGRKLERAIFRISMTNLSPARIFQYLRADMNQTLCPFITSPPQLDSVIRDIRGGERIAGLKSLVKQTQSNSLYRSVAALSALILLSTSWDKYLESLANALDDLHPEKKYFLFLIAIARARLRFNGIELPPENMEEFAINCRQRLLEILDSSRHDPLVVIADACLLLENFSSCFCWIEMAFTSLTPAVLRVMETAYFLLIFLVRFLIDQHQTFNNMHPLQRLILSTFSRWLERVADYIISCMGDFWDLPHLPPICAFSILRLSMSNLQFGVLSPRHIPRRLDSLYFFPRRIRNATSQEGNPIILQSYLSICTIRTHRLIVSPDELRREAGDSIKLENDLSSDGLYNPPLYHKSEEILQRSFERARSIAVVDNDLTREFLRARNSPDYEWLSYKNLGHWKTYKELQQKRHRIGKYCRSNLDWDWDTSSSLKRLFRIDRPRNSSRTEGAVQQGVTGVPTIHRGINGGTLEVTIPDKAPNVLEKVVRIRYETEAGEVRYRTFYAGPSAEDVTSDACADSRPRSSLAPETGSLIGESIEARGEVPKAASRDEMENTEVADEVHEEERCFRELNGASDTEDGNALVDSTDRPQYDSRIDEWLETQVCVPMGD